MIRFLFLLSLTSLHLFAQKKIPLGAVVNSEFNEIHPLVSPDGQTLYFVRANHPSNTHGRDGSNDVWFSEKKGDKWSLAKRMPPAINKDKYNDIFSITPDGQTMLIRGVYLKGKRQNEVGISISTKTKAGWSQPDKVNIPKLDVMCKGDYLSAFLSNDGKSMILAFSEKKNSTADDLYISLKDRQGNWSKPLSLGTQINTDFSETTPFLASDNQTLYFASNRPGGQGGFDIWVSKRLNRTWQKWSKPINLGETINSKEDDLYYSLTSDGKYAFLTTKDKSVGKGDIVYFDLQSQTEETDDNPILAGKTGSADTDKGEKNTNTLVNTAPEPVVMYSGKVVNPQTGQPVDARIVYEVLSDDPNELESGVANTNPLTGEYKIVLPYGKTYSVRAEAKDFIATSQRIDLTQKGAYKEMSGGEMRVIPISIGSSITLNNIFFEFGKATLQPSSFPELNRILEIMQDNPTLEVEIQGHTDNVGTAAVNKRISQERADAVRAYLLQRKITATRIKSSGFGFERPIASNDTPEGQAQNRRVDFVILKK